MRTIVKPIRKAVQGVQAAWTAPEKWAYTRGLRSPASLSLPDFLCIGAQKAGTSWLYENLRCHPDLFLPDQKELHFFDRRYHRSLRFYARKFVAGAGKVKGEITPAYSSLPLERIRFIGSVMPNLRLILLLRDPVERAWSHAQMHLLEKQAKRRYEEVDEAEFFAHFSGEDSRGKGDYLGMLDRWLSIFPASQLYVGFFEDIQERPQELLAEVFRHLGVTDEVDWAGFPFRQVVNKGHRTPMPEKYQRYLEELYAADIERMCERFGARANGWRRKKSPRDL